MFSFFKKKKSTEVVVPNGKRDNGAIKIATGLTATDSAFKSTQEATEHFAKPSEYDRSVLDDGAAKRNVKLDAFNTGVDVRDPYTGDKLTLTKAEARAEFGDDWTSHLAEADHIVPLAERYEQTKNNPWLSNDDIKASSNSSDNLEVVSRRFNNAKRSRSNEEFVSDEEYLQKTGIELTENGKARAIRNEQSAQDALERRDFIDSTDNIIQTGHKAGVSALKQAGTMGLTMSGIRNIVSVLKGEKEAGEAVEDTLVDGGKAAARGYVMGSGLTVISHTLSNSSSEFLRALAKSNVPGKVITAVMVTGDTLKRFATGEISTQECIIELGDKGLNFATAGYSMAVGQALIPIPVVGAAVGALVGSALTSSYYNQLITQLKTKELEHQERLRIMEECRIAETQALEFRVQLEEYLDSYFRDYRTCFDDALDTIHDAFASGDADRIISGANQITRKLGGKTNYNNMTEFREFICSDEVDVF